jgi:hypothetical protein
MNIFFLHWCPKKAAKYHVDRHVIKMILETAQLLCSVHWMLNSTAHYKLTHKNHPSAVWARFCVGNYLWLVELGLALCEEYRFRYGEHKRHKSQSILEDLAIRIPAELPHGPVSPPPQAMPDEFKRPHNLARAAYRDYYTFNKAHLHSWKNRPIPSFITKRLLSQKKQHEEL